MKPSCQFAVILCGGSGTRLWPLSTSEFPKQFLNLVNDESLIQNTIRRLLEQISVKNIRMIAPPQHVALLQQQVRAVNPLLIEGIRLEPCARNTLAPTVFMALEIAEQDPNAVMSVFPSDAAIENPEELQRAWLLAQQSVTDNIILVGVKPDHPATQFGYIRAQPGDTPILEVNGFVEKPDFEKAQKLFQEPGLFWNAGIFVFLAQTLIHLMEEHQPEMLRKIREFRRLHHSDEQNQVYAALPKLSFDYGILEKTKNLRVVPTKLNWSDVGTWQSYVQFHEKTFDGLKERNNQKCGPVVFLESENIFACSAQQPIFIHGLKDIAVLSGKEATVVMPRSELSEFSGKLEEVKAQLKEIRSPNVVEKPWGRYENLSEAPGYKVKSITVNPGHKLSLQMHHHRSEHWVVVRGEADVQIEDKIFRLRENESTYIPKGAKHRLANLAKNQLLEIIETQIGDQVDEDDIVRFADDYGRLTGVR